METIKALENRDFGPLVERMAAEAERIDAAERVKPTELEVAEQVRRIQLEIARRHRECGEHYAARIAAGHAGKYTRKIRELESRPVAPLAKGGDE